MSISQFQKILVDPSKFIYFEKAKRQKKSFMTPTRANLTEKPFDTFKAIYSRFRNEDEHKVSDDAIGLIVPSTPANTPRNLAAEGAWTMLTTLRPKHSQPKVG